MAGIRTLSPNDAFNEIDHEAFPAGQTPLRVYISITGVKPAFGGPFKGVPGPNGFWAITSPGEPPASGHYVSSTYDWEFDFLFSTDEYYLTDFICCYAGTSYPAFTHVNTSYVFYGENLHDAFNLTRFGEFQIFTRQDIVGIPNFVRPIEEAGEQPAFDLFAEHFPIDDDYSHLRIARRRDHSRLLIKYKNDSF
jgi:hypothetical protein